MPSLTQLPELAWDLSGFLGGTMALAKSRFTKSSVYFTLSGNFGHTVGCGGRFFAQWTAESPARLALFHLPAR